MLQARAVADLCYQTDADAPLRRAAFGSVGGVIALVAMLHASHPTSPVGVSVADALRLLALDGEPQVALAVEQRGGIQMLEDIVKLAPTATGAVAKCVAVLKGQLERVEHAQNGKEEEHHSGTPAEDPKGADEALAFSTDESASAGTRVSLSGPTLSVWPLETVRVRRCLATSWQPLVCADWTHWGCLQSDITLDGEAGKMVFRFDIRVSNREGDLAVHTLRSRFSNGAFICRHTVLCFQLNTAWLRLLSVMVVVMLVVVVVGVVVVVVAAAVALQEPCATKLWLRRKTSTRFSIRH